MRFWLKSAAAILAFLALAALPVQAQVPDPYARELAQRLVGAEHVLTDLGYMRAAGPFSGQLAERDAQRILLTLRAGQAYGVIGVCDNRCSALTIEVFDVNNTLVSREAAAEATPIAQVIPNATGPYTVQVTMAHCNGPGCWYAFNVYSR